MSVTDFLIHESRLLDERRFREWLALFTPDATYWVPYAPEQTSPTDHVSLFYEDVALLAMRVDRLERGLSPLEWPPARVNRHLSNFSIEAQSPRIIARGLLLFVEHRRDEQRLFSARCRWELLAQDDGFRIAAKRVDLLNADQESGHLRFAVPF